MFKKPLDSLFLSVWKRVTRDPEQISPFVEIFQDDRLWEYLDFI